MDYIPREHRIDYRLIFFLLTFLAGVCGYLLEKMLLSRIANDDLVQLTSYLDSILNNKVELWKLFRYLVTYYLKFFLLIFISCVTVLGFPITILISFTFIFRYAFFTSALLHHPETTHKIGVIMVGLLPVLFLLPVFFFCFRVAYESFSYCIKNNKRWYRFTKKQLQNLIKLGIIMIIILFLEAFAESFLCTVILDKLFLMG